MKKPDKLGMYHSTRFRDIDNAFPRAVANAYDGDIAMALEHSLSQVFDKVRDCEIREGRKPQNWRIVAVKAALEEAGHDGGPLDLLRLIWDRADDKERRAFLKEVKC